MQRELKLLARFPGSDGTFETPFILVRVMGAPDQGG